MHVRKGQLLKLIREENKRLRRERDMARIAFCVALADWKEASGRIAVDMQKIVETRHKRKAAEYIKEHGGRLKDTWAFGF